jgi:CheY-like chemotaxis protein
MLVDIDPGDENGFEVTERLHRAGWPAPPPLILISTHDEEDLADLVAASSAVGFAAKVGLSGFAIRDLLAGSVGTEEGDHR